MKICVVSGSRADYGLLEWPVKTLKENDFKVEELNIWGTEFHRAAHIVGDFLKDTKPDLMLVLGDRYEILGAVTAAHLQRIPISHIGGGDVTEGSYDDAMRDAISRMASIHFVTSTSSMARLTHMGYRNVHLVGNPGVDYIRHAKWKGKRPIVEPYVVVSYQAETIDDDGENVGDVMDILGGKKCVYIWPNPDRGSDKICALLEPFMAYGDIAYDYLPHDQFLNLIYHCEEFIGNSSSMLYEAPELGIKTRMIGKRQRGRTIPWGDGQASQRIANIFRYTICGNT